MPSHANLSVMAEANEVFAEQAVLRCAGRRPLCLQSSYTSLGVLRMYESYEEKDCHGDTLSWHGNWHELSSSLVLQSHGNDEPRSGHMGSILKDR